jgi:nucleoside phosphorylase
MHHWQWKWTAMRVAKVCFDYGVPFATACTISDRADHTAQVDFPHLSLM